MKPWQFFRRRRWLQLTIAGIAAVALAAFVAAPSTWPIDSYEDCIQAGYPILDTNPPICREGTHNYSGTPLPVATAAPVADGVPFELLVGGDTHSAIPGHEQTVINDDAQWQQYWAHVHAGLPQLPPLIPVDFGNSSVVAVSLGQKATTGYGLKITSIETGERGSVITLNESTPSITCPVSQTISNRYLIVRTQKLNPPYTYRITPDTRRCQQPS